MARIRAAWIRRRTRRAAGAHGHRCPPAARRATTRAPAWFAHHATPTRHLPCVAPAVAVAAFSSYESPRNGSKNQIDLIDRPSPADHNVSICNDSSAPHRHGCPCRMAHRPHDPIVPCPRGRRACPPSRRSARSRTVVRPRLDLSRRTRCAARQALPRDTGDVLHRRGPAAPRMPLAAAAHGSAGTDSCRVGGCTVCRCRPVFPPSRRRLSRPACEVCNLLEYRRARHHRLADCRA
ncbi:MAG: hypothetical protein GAK33_04254 [Burkholderia lata]|uniref:Uncharacterized protein n=1 Tax=Burkholderia lata (strain ATCC 17760 / DSM 23089 / LMG 22485 / NCIMB 9086 / R18194 / 383) TaxID=482957 RepID=A0A833PM33_BURL3|nr:MAG: hypothetical protein GAK33_04254 [Burkholderia lata]